MPSHTEGETYARAASGDRSTPPSMYPFASLGPSPMAVVDRPPPMIANPAIGGGMSALGTFSSSTPKSGSARAVMISAATTPRARPRVNTRPGGGVTPDVPDSTTRSLASSSSHQNRALVPMPLSLTCSTAADHTSRSSCALPCRS